MFQRETWRSNSDFILSDALLQLTSHTLTPEELKHCVEHSNLALHGCTLSSAVNRLLPLTLCCCFIFACKSLIFAVALRFTSNQRIRDETKYKVKHAQKDFKFKHSFCLLIKCRLIKSLDTFSLLHFFFLIFYNSF